MKLIVALIGFGFTFVGFLFVGIFNFVSFFSTPTQTPIEEKLITEDRKNKQSLTYAMNEIVKQDRQPALIKHEFSKGASLQEYLTAFGKGPDSDIAVIEKGLEQFQGAEHAAEREKFFDAALKIESREQETALLGFQEIILNTTYDTEDSRLIADNERLQLTALKVFLKNEKDSEERFRGAVLSLQSQSNRQIWTALHDEIKRTFPNKADEISRSAPPPFPTN